MPVYLMKSIFYKYYPKSDQRNSLLSRLREISYNADTIICQISRRPLFIRHSWAPETHLRDIYTALNRSIPVGGGDIQTYLPDRDELDTSAKIGL
jgi:hypothetical protein